MKLFTRHKNRSNIETTNGGNSGNEMKKLGMKIATDQASPTEYTRWETESQALKI